MLNLRSLAERVKTECPVLNPDPRVVRGLAKVGKTMAQPSAIFNRVQNTGTDFLLGGGLSEKPRSLKNKGVRCRHRW